MSTAGRVVLVGGGVRSGKSAFALSRAKTLGERRVFIATAESLDEEMADRISRHRAERGDNFQTVEEPLAVPEALARVKDAGVVVIDCFAFWLSNLLLRDQSPEVILARVSDLVAEMGRRRFHTVVVTDEVGMGVVPPTPLGRMFRDVCGLANQEVARAADEIYLAALGTVLRLKPGPVEATFAALE